MKIYIYQIYYDDRTKLQITKPFIPLDNSKNERDDWFEFLPILNFLRKNNLEDDAWYGFLSPRFHEKTGLKSEFIFNVIEKIGHEADVAIFSHGWDQLSYFLNPWEQGEAWHPGLLNATQKFLDSQGVLCNIRELVTDTTSSVFSNYIIAKKQYWQEWKKIAEDFYKYSEDPKNYLNDTKVCYGTQESQYPLKTFIQERFASLILARGKYKTIAKQTWQIQEINWIVDSSNNKRVKVNNIEKAISHIKDEGGFEKISTIDGINSVSLRRG